MKRLVRCNKQVANHDMIHLRSGAPRSSGVQCNLHAIAALSWGWQMQFVQST